LDGFDVSQRIVVVHILDLPFGKGKRFANSLSPVANKVISGWGIDGVTTLQTGFPLSTGGYDGDGWADLFVSHYVDFHEDPIHLAGSGGSSIYASQDVLAAVCDEPDSPMASGLGINRKTVMLWGGRFAALGYWRLVLRHTSYSC
jgi:hypothetical protein